MKTMNRLKDKYESLGFVEALIAIMIVGVSSIILMEIAVNTMQNTIQNEVIDTMTQYAVEGAEMAQQISDRDLQSSDRDLFPKPTPGTTVCYRFISELDSETNRQIFSFAKTTENTFIQYNEDDRNTYKEEALIEEEELFRIFCLEGSSGEKNFVIGRVIVGQRYSDGSITRGNAVKDYSYLTVIKR